MYFIILLISFEALNKAPQFMYLWRIEKLSSKCTPYLFTDDNIGTEVQVSAAAL